MKKHGVPDEDFYRGSIGGDTESERLRARIAELERVLGEVEQSLIPIVKWTSGDCYCIGADEILVADGKTCPTCYAKKAIAEIESVLGKGE